MITQEQIEFYSKNGYLIVNNILSDDEIKNFYSEILKYANKDFAAIMNPDRIEFLIAQNLDRLNQMSSLKEQTDFIEDCQKIANLTWKIISNSKAVAILETLQQMEVSYLMSQMLFKQAQSKYAPQAWTPHQDNAYPRNEVNNLSNKFTTQYITTNFFLEDANLSNGTIYVYPGSHKYGLFDSEFRPSYREKVGSNPGNTISKKVLSQFEKVDCSFKKGDMLILNGNCIHGSYPNTHPTNSRPLLSVSYITKGSPFNPGNNAKRKEISLK